jgi:hypothetical protein
MLVWNNYAMSGGLRTRLDDNVRVVVSSKMTGTCGCKFEGWNGWEVM